MFLSFSGLPVLLFVTWSKMSSNLGLFSGCSFQHCFMSTMHSSGAWSGDTTGRHIGGGFRTFWTISSIKYSVKLQKHELLEKYVYKTINVIWLVIFNRPSTDWSSMQNGGPRITTSCIMIEKLYTSPGRLPYKPGWDPLNISGAVHRRSAGYKYTLAFYECSGIAIMRQALLL